ncbi:MAG: DUF523 domain-containing protein [Acidimicrobiales bacterium]|nr:DUF523 domain-containing protein [Acidimicrobiales bacterium]
MGERSAESARTEGYLPQNRSPLIVSACLLGVACNHVGRSSPSSAVVRLGRDRRLIPVCPETAGGLPTPRPAAEIAPSGRVMTAAGDDVTDAYERGSAQAVRLAQAAGAGGAVLKARSPSCGCHEVYDGTFSRTRVPGEGVTARALRAAGVPAWSDEDVEAGADLRRGSDER